MPPRNMHTTMATSPSPPLRLPISAWATRTRRMAMPARSNRMPARMNTGNARSGYLATPE